MTRPFITGCSGYIGGEVLAQINEQRAKYSDFEIFATYRKDEHADALRERGVEPVLLDLENVDKLKTFVKDKNIDVAIDLTDFSCRKIAPPVIEAFSELGGNRTFIATGGAKLFSTFSGIDPSYPVYDDADDPFETPHTSEPPALDVAPEVVANWKAMFALAKRSGAKVHLVIPPVVYGQSRTFGNPLSIQIVDLVRIAKATGHLWAQRGSGPYAQCHIYDCASLYLALLDKRNSAPSGYYFAETGAMDWTTLSRFVLNGLKLDAYVKPASDEELKAMANALDVSVPYLDVRCGGSNNIHGRNGRKIGWKPKYDVEHLYNTAEDETRFIVEHM